MSRPPASLAIRADGDARLGFGHVMRSAALAQALLDAGHRVVWFSQTPRAVPAALASRIEIRAIAPDSDEAGDLLPALADAGASGLIGDWQITKPELCRQLREAGVWLALIGNHLGGADADLMIHQGFGPASTNSPANICDGSEHILLAPAYAKLPPRTVNPRVKRLLISFGGSETPILDAVLSALEGLSELRGVEIEIKRAAPRATALPEAGLLDALRAADIAILGAGTTLHEAAATGLAVIALPITANQLERARQFEALGLGLSLDPAAEGFDPHLRQALGTLLHAPAPRQAFARAGQAIIDGRGASRVASRVSDLASGGRTQLNSTISTMTAGPAP